MRLLLKPGGAVKEITEQRANTRSFPVLVRGPVQKPHRAFVFVNCWVAVMHNKVQAGLTEPRDALVVSAPVTKLLILAKRGEHWFTSCILEPLAVLVCGVRGQQPETQAVVQHFLTTNNDHVPLLAVTKPSLAVSSARSRS